MGGEHVVEGRVLGVVIHGHEDEQTGEFMPVGQTPVVAPGEILLGADVGRLFPSVQDVVVRLHPHEPGDVVGHSSVGVVRIGRLARGGIVLGILAIQVLIWQGPDLVVPVVAGVDAGVRDDPQVGVGRVAKDEALERIGVALPGHGGRAVLEGQGYLALGRIQLRALPVTGQGLAA